jgi:hypothetical protein
MYSISIPKGNGGVRKHTHEFSFSFGRAYPTQTAQSSVKVLRIRGFTGCTISKELNMNTKSVMLSALVVGGIIFSANAPSFAGNSLQCHQNREARFDTRHPRRSEVLDRTGNLNQRINANRGNLDGHYYQLKRADASIRRQEQRDARINGGYITKGQQQQLNHEENRLNNQIKRDQ